MAVFYCSWLQVVLLKCYKNSWSSIDPLNQPPLSDNAVNLIYIAVNLIYILIYIVSGQPDLHCLFFWDSISPCNSNC